MNAKFTDQTAAAQIFASTPLALSIAIAQPALNSSLTVTHAKTSTNVSTPPALTNALTNPATSVVTARLV